MKPEIRTLAKGEKITEPGFWAISMDRHHGQPCEGLAVTSSILRTMEIGTPADVWAFHPENPNAYESKSSQAMLEGQIMAYLVEGGPEAVLEHFVIIKGDAPKRPTKAQIRAFDKKGVWSDAAAPGAAFWEDVDRKGKVPIKQETYANILLMGKALLADPGAVALMDGEPEISMAWKDEETGLWLLARPDMVNFDGFVGDYKKMATRGKFFSYQTVDRAITEHGYDMQLAFASEVFERLMDFWPEQAAIIAQCDQAPYHVIPREISQEDIQIGMFRNRAALRRFKECRDSGHWPGPGEDMGFYQRPEWQRKILMERMDMMTGHEEAPPPPDDDEDDIGFGEVTTLQG